ncbi:5-deoxy-glucuronate isomerase [Amycolatopsis sp. NPDC089917]|uniref:5-deoxy-glucuronate isomerase n=1 Tax=Amycolatopsis sp. NPDC089917 TaxID=3155187 RepID=UPI0034211013
MERSELLLRCGETGHGNYRTDLSPETARWSWSGLKILVLPAGAVEETSSGPDEVIVLPLAGSCEVVISETKYLLRGRDSVFTALSDFLYIPRNASFSVSSKLGGRFALATARASTDRTVSYWPVRAVNSELRGGGSNSRQVNNYSIGNELETDHLLVCEVLTPGGCWSSYPPHKHDEHSMTERELEEIYYFEIGEGPASVSRGFGTFTTYGTPSRPLLVQECVFDGDIALVPHGYHGPCAAAPGYDMYYLNVMAGPAEDRSWKVSFDPDHDWVRDSMAKIPLDPRLPMTQLSDE